MQCTGKSTQQALRSLGEGQPAAYLFGRARNHAFVDGHKRIAIVTAAVFLMENGYEIEATDAELYAFVVAVAAGGIDEDGARRLLADHTLPRR